MCEIITAWCVTELPFTFFGSGHVTVIHAPLSLHSVISARRTSALMLIQQQQQQGTATFALNQHNDNDAVVAVGIELTTTAYSTFGRYITINL